MMPKFNTLEWTLILCAGFLTGCAYAWKEGQKVDVALVHKVESELAPKFCTDLLGVIRRGCAVRLINTENGITRCVIVILPNDPESITHEPGHCLGWDHP